VIVKIDRQLLNKFNIIEYDIKKYLRQEEINIPEDDEIILVNEEDGSFPKEIIVAFLAQSIFPVKLLYP